MQRDKSDKEGQITKKGIVWEIGREGNMIILVWKRGASARKGKGGQRMRRKEAGEGNVNAVCGERVQEKKSHTV